MAGPLNDVKVGHHEPIWGDKETSSGFDRGVIRVEGDNPYDRGLCLCHELRDCVRVRDYPRDGQDTYTKDGPMGTNQAGTPCFPVSLSAMLLTAHSLIGLAPNYVD